MKNFTSALLAVTAFAALAGSVNADGAASASKTGAYVGGSAGMANTNVKYGYSNVGSNATVGGSGNVTAGTAIGAGTSSAQVQNSQAGSFGGLFGLFAGYGMQFGSSMYFGGEVYGGLDTAKVTTFNDNGSGALAPVGNNGSAYPLGSGSVKRTSYYGLAPRIGAFITPSTMIYARLGIESGKWEARYNFSGADLGSSAGKSVTGKKAGIAFAPGLGLEAYISNNLFLRAEYTYLFGPTVKLNVDTNSSNSWGGTYVRHSFKVTQQSFKVGVGYKF